MGREEGQVSGWRGGPGERVVWGVGSGEWAGRRARWVGGEEG